MINNLFRTICMVGLTLMSLALAGCVSSEQKELDDRGRKAKSHVFSVHDLDEDGQLSRAEYQRLVEYREKYCKSKYHSCRPSLEFELIDIDNDKFISEDEMAKTLSSHLKEHRRYRYRGGQEKIEKE